MTGCFLFSAILPILRAETHFKEDFSDENAMDRWTQSTVSEYGAFALEKGVAYGDVLIGKGIRTSMDSKFYALSAPIEKPFTNFEKNLVLAFTVKHDQQIDCGGGYIKVLPDLDGEKFTGDSEYFIMFGPDICGHVRKIHLIFHYKGTNLLWKKEPRCADDTLTHAYKLILKPDNTYEVHLDSELIESGSLEEDWDFLPPKVIDDPDDKKPADWVDAEMIDDPTDSKPADWDAEPEKIPDPAAKKPEHWDDEEDGTWEAPTLQNPKYRGEWKAKRIPNPAYKGKWAPRKIDNPNYQADDTLYLTRKPLARVGFDLWQVKSGSIFDNIILSDSETEVDAFLEAKLKGVNDKERSLIIEKNSSEASDSAQDELSEDL